MFLTWNFPMEMFYWFKEKVKFKFLKYRVIVFYEKNAKFFSFIKWVFSLDLNKIIL